MTDNEQSYLCVCGLPGCCEVLVHRPPVILTDLPWGKYPCRRCYGEFQAYRDRIIAEWHGYFAEIWPDVNWPDELQVQKALLAEKLGRPELSPV